MINIVTSSDSNKLISNLDAFFNNRVFRNRYKFEDLDLYVMKKVDSAYIIDMKLGTIQTKYGITDLRHLSTGCKVILSYLYMMRNKDKYEGVTLDITECGGSAIEVLFQCVDKFGDESTVFLLRHSEGLLRVKDRVFNVNNKNFDSLVEGVRYYV